MKSPANGVHESEGYPTIQLLLVSDGHDHFKRQKDSASFLPGQRILGKTVWACSINGVLGLLTVKTEDGEPDGWDWEGPDLSDESLQRALDCTDMHFTDCDE
jgi:hypothetical protein